MENIFIIIVGILFLLAISDLVVGVSNDAVNFTNSAVGSKVAPMYVIMIVAAVGILLGTTFSSGMMEVARKGIFNPDMFTFQEIMFIFLAVMTTDILLLDFFNTLGLPTSTTVSLIFELLGAAVGMAVIKIKALGVPMSELGSYINSASALTIISGILVSIVIAFTVGAIVQFIVRIMFSFNYKKTYKYFGAIWGGIAISAITYFLLIKGAKGSSIISDTTLEWINGHTFQLLLYSCLGSAVLLQILHWLFRVNILKIIVLLGTFALAMAFAGNDLVNFIGVPMAGYESFKAYEVSGVVDPTQYNMGVLNEKVQAPLYFLLIAGVIMVVTLWVSKKARSVTKTEVSLGRQDEGYERFGSSLMARAIVRLSVGIAGTIGSIVPRPVKKWLDTRFDNKPVKKQQKKEKVSFDLIRASVNLVVSSALIALGTSRKLPLSTTYVTFMVAMATSLSDRAWSRDSAVYRVTGVFTVIGGWFITAIVAFTIALLIVLFISWAEIIGIIILIAGAVFLLTRTHIFHKKRIKEEKEEEGALDMTAGMPVVERCKFNLTNSVETIAECFASSITGLVLEKRKKLKRSQQAAKELNKKTKGYKRDMYTTIKELQNINIDTGAYYVQVVDSLRETVTSLQHITKPVFDYVDNKHQPLQYHQKEELTTLKNLTEGYFELVKKILKESKFEKMPQLTEVRKEISKALKSIKKNQIMLLQEGKISTRNSILYLELLNETKNLVVHMENVCENQVEFEKFEAR